MHWRIGVLAVVGAMTVGGCGLADAVSMSPHVGRASTTSTAAARPVATSAAVRPAAAVASAAPVATASASGSGSGSGSGDTASAATVPGGSPVATARRTPGDLDTGAVTHTLAAGAYHLVIDYWTSQSPATWTASTPVIVQLSAHMEGGPADQASATHRPAIEVTRFTGTVNDGVTLTPVANDIGQFALTPPYSYGSALQLPGSHPSSTAAVVTTQFDLLIETTPTSGAFYRQTVIDTLHLSFAPEEQTP